MFPLIPITLSPHPIIHRFRHRYFHVVPRLTRNEHIPNAHITMEKAFSKCNQTCYMYSEPAVHDQNGQHTNNRIHNSLNEPLIIINFDEGGANCLKYESTANTVGQLAPVSGADL